MKVEKHWRLTDMERKYCFYMVNGTILTSLIIIFSFRSRLPGGAVFLKSYLKKSWKKSHEKILQWTLFFRKDARTAGNFSKKETPSLFFSCEFCDIFSNSFFKKHFRVTAFVFSSSGSWFHARVKVSFTFIASHTIKSS